MSNAETIIANLINQQKITGEEAVTLSKSLRDCHTTTSDVPQLSKDWSDITTSPYTLNSNSLTASL